MATGEPIPLHRLETHGTVCGAVVVHVLGATLVEKHPADRSLAAVLKANHQLGSRDRRLISETLFAVLRWWGWLRHLAPQDMVAAIGTGRVPATTLSQWVPLFAAAWLLECREELPPGVLFWLRQAGVAPEKLPSIPPNAPLRDRRKLLRPFFSAKGTLPPLPEEALIPSWAIEKIASPRPLTELIDWLQRRPPVWLRAQTANTAALWDDLQQEGLQIITHQQLANAAKAQFAGVNLRLLPAFSRGEFEIQDLASQAVGYICAPQPGSRWWDACAGGGGKSLHLAWLMNRKGSLLATDNRAYKLQDLKLRARRAQFPNIRTKEWLGVPVPRYNASFNGVLVDTACSCSGTWRRNPDARWTTFPQDLPELTALQTQLLTNAADAVAPGGTLVYSTCSLFQEENDAIVQAFLNQHPDFALTPFVCPVTGRQTDGTNQLWPWDGDCDAMFCAKMTRATPLRN